MKKSVLIMAVAAGLMLAGTTSQLFAGYGANKDKQVTADKQITITGMAMCAKCALHESDTCQTVIQVNKDGKTVTYWLTPNDTATKFHKNICTTPGKATATGTITTVDGKKTMTVTKIELVK